MVYSIRGETKFIQSESIKNEINLYREKKSMIFKSGVNDNIHENPSPNVCFVFILIKDIYYNIMLFQYNKYNFLFKKKN